MFYTLHRKWIVLDNWPYYTFRADNSQPKVFINDLLHNRLPSPHFTKLSWLCIIRILFQFPILSLYLSKLLERVQTMLFFNFITLEKKKKFHINVSFFSILSLSQKNSKTEKVSATSWRSGLTAHVDGKRKWWPQQTPPPINTEMRPSPLSPRLRCAWGCITTKETGPSARWLLCSLQKEVRARCVQGSDWWDLLLSYITSITCGSTVQT